LFDEYLGSEERILMLDSEGYKVFSTMYILDKGHSASIVSSKNKYSLENIKKWIIKNNKSFELLSKKYVSNHSQLSLKCLIDGHKWKASWASIQGHHGCPVCGHGGGDGFFNISRAKKNKDKWINIDCSVYVINLYDEKENFYKIGITTQKLKRRFRQIPYNYNVLNVIETNLYNAVLIESEMHDRNTSFSYDPKKDFAGKTECFYRLK
jgi:hypothetical protein